MIRVIHQRINNVLLAVLVASAFLVDRLRELRTPVGIVAAVAAVIVIVLCISNLVFRSRSTGRCEEDAARAADEVAPDTSLMAPSGDDERETGNLAFQCRPARHKQIQRAIEYQHYLLRISDPGSESMGAERTAEEQLYQTWAIARQLFFGEVRSRQRTMAKEVIDIVDGLATSTKPVEYEFEFDLKSGRLVIRASAKRTSEPGSVLDLLQHFQIHSVSQKVN